MLLASTIFGSKYLLSSPYSKKFQIYYSSFLLKSSTILIKKSVSSREKLALLYVDPLAERIPCRNDLPYGNLKIMRALIDIMQYVCSAHVSFFALFISPSLSIPTTVSTCSVQGNMSTGCTAMTLYPPATSISISRPSVAGSQET